MAVDRMLGTSALVRYVDPATLARRLLTPLLLVACGPSSVLDAGTTSSGDAPETVTSTVPATAPTGSSDGSDVGGTSDGFDPPPAPACVASPVAGSDPIDPNDCSTFVTDPDMVPTEVTQRIVNHRPTPIAVPPMYCCVSPERWVDVTGTAGGRELRDVARCVDTAEESYWLCDWFATGRGDACILLYFEHPTICIEPGGYFETTWFAGVLATGTLPDACSDNAGGQSCEVIIPAPPGTYEMTTHAVALDTDACGCTPSSRGSCEQSSVGETPTLVASAAWDGACNEVTLVFE